MKKLIAMATALCLCTTGFYLPNNSKSVFSSISASAETSAEDFRFIAETGTITRYIGSDTDIIIPFEILLKLHLISFLMNL